METTKSWRGVKTVEAAKHLIQNCILLQWQDMRIIKRVFTEAQQVEIMEFFAEKLCVSTEDRLACEIIVESVLIWLANNVEEPYISGYVTRLLREPEYFQASRLFVEIALTSEVSETEHDEEIYALAVGVICELGIRVHASEAEQRGKLPKAGALLDHITTYLLSVSNHSNSCIRLSLLHYFGLTSQLIDDKASFNRVMSRFGHTALDHLFSLLFEKKSEGVSLQYLMQNLPYVLNADSNSQRILHETFKYYMLKKPERFALFLQTFSEHLLQSFPLGDTTHLLYVQHLGALFKVVAELNHKNLARDILLTMQKFQSESFYQRLLQQLLEDVEIRTSFKDLVRHLLKASDAIQFVESVSQFRTSKRGRKPSFARALPMGIIGQVTFLGGIEIAKAS